jgi:hypothetical protein
MSDVVMRCTETAFLVGADIRTHASLATRPLRQASTVTLKRFRLLKLAC